MFEEYKYTLFESGEDGDEYMGPYKTQIDNLNKFFSWDFTAKSLSNDDIIKFYSIMKMPLQDVMDYLVVCKQDKQISDWKKSKNILAL